MVAFPSAVKIPGTFVPNISILQPPLRDRLEKAMIQHIDRSKRRGYQHGKT